MSEISQVWLNTAQAALSFVSLPLVNERWASASCLPEMTVGALSGHLLHSGIFMLEDALNGTDVPGGSTRTAATVFSWVPLEEADPANADVRFVAESESGEGQTDLVSRAAASMHRISESLDRTPPDRVVAFFNGTIPMTLDQLLRARVLELVVHLDDLICSVGVTKLPLPKEAVALTCHLGLDINLTRYGHEEVLRALFRRDRAAGDALRTF
jgi:hypothetical protein